MNGVLRLEGVTKRFGETTAVADLTLEVAPGELLTLLGPSGCGKTTTLRMIAGFETPTSGRILLDGKEITRLPPQRRGFGMVFQNYALFPHLDVFENVAFGLKGRGLARAEIGRRVEEALALVDLEGYGRRKVQQLSGGQQQRVALARALAPEPRIILLDEPLSNLDAALRERTRAELRSLLERLGITAIFVTHDQEEAFELSDRIAIMQGGTLQQVGTPELLYLQPVNPFVATFLGRANFLEGRVLEWDRDEHEQEEAAGTWLLCELPGGVRWRVRAAIPTPGEVARIMVRPEALAIAPASHPDGLEATITERLFAGPATLYRVRVAEAELSVLGRAGDGRPGDRVRLHLTPDAVPLAFAPQIPRPGPAAQNVSPSPTVTVGT